MEIKKGNQVFYMGETETDAVAKIAYKVKDENTIIANSTYVDPSLRGQNIAKKLLDRLAEFAKDEGVKIYPTCSYVVKMFERSKDYDDVKV